MVGAVRRGVVLLAAVSEQTANARGRQPIRIIVVDDHQMILDGLASMLAPYRDAVEVVAATTDPEEAKRVAAAESPDIALLDVRIGPVSGLGLCPELLAVAPQMRVV
ncbi:MAG: response regulator transcription factor, partial [Acidimicrobiales bacterium]